MAVSSNNLLRVLPAIWTRCLSSSCNRWSGTLDYSGKEHLLTIKEVRTHLMDMVDARGKWGEAKDPWQSRGVVQPVAESQSELPARKPSDSFVRSRIPLSDSKARDKYLLFNGGIRFGRLLEDFDTMAGLICYQHNKNPKYEDDQKSPYAFVTVLVDRIEQSTLSEELSSKKDIYIQGNVTWVGTSSMECSMFMEQEIDGKIQQFLSAKYLFAARNPLTNKAGCINPLDPQTPEEKAAFQLGEENKKKRTLEGTQSLLKTPPSESERLTIHDLFLSTIDQKSGSLKVRIQPQNTVWMEDTKLKSLIVCNPEQRNLYNKIFGGFLMRAAYELAWITATTYSKKTPRMCKVVDDILFKRPVEIGSLLFLSSQVVYSQEQDLQVHVHAEVLYPEEDRRETTNDFHFTFDTGIPDLPRVMPKTYAEAMMYLMGKRHYES